MQYDVSRGIHISIDACRWFVGKEVAYPSAILDCLFKLALFRFRSDWLPRFNSYRVEASWKLGQWKELEKYLKEVGVLEGLGKSLRHSYEFRVGACWEQKVGCEFGTVVACS